jgi:Family of unknown function (DUF5990)
MAVTAKSAKRPLRVRIEGTSLPGGTFCEHRHVHVGVQYRAEAVDLVPGDAEKAAFEFEVDIVPAADGTWDFRGPYVHGKPRERFLYLTWGDRTPDGEFAMFRRAKLHLSGLDSDLAAKAADPGHRLVARLALTDARGGPRCASVRPSAIVWSGEPRDPYPPPEQRP